MAALASTPRIMINMSQTSLNLDMTRSVSCALKWLLRKFLSSPKKSLSISLLAPSPSFLIERWILLPSTIWYSCKCDESKNKKYITRKIILLAFNYVNSDLFSNLRKPWIHQRAAAEDPSKGYISGSLPQTLYWSDGEIGKLPTPYNGENGNWKGGVPILILWQWSKTHWGEISSGGDAP